MRNDARGSTPDKTRPDRVKGLFLRSRVAPSATNARDAAKYHPNGFRK